MDTNKITNVLIFKDGFYWLTIEIETGENFGIKGCYRIAHMEKNGFEFASDAYAYLVSLRPSSPIVEYNPREEERLKEMGEVE
jgi:hypothetical protein